MEHLTAGKNFNAKKKIKGYRQKADNRIKAQKMASFKPGALMPEVIIYIFREEYYHGTHNQYQHGVFKCTV